MILVLGLNGRDAIGATITTSTIWIQPDEGTTATAGRWGHRNGLQVGLSGKGGPHGLLYLYYDAVVKKPGHPLNFIAIEPVVRGVRGYSELEPSKLDGRAGKRLWSGTSPSTEPRQQNDCVRGVTGKDGIGETLQVYVMVEPFSNGARVYLRLTFRSGAPGELDFEVFSSPGSASMSHCILTATMGNFARLRELHLKDSVITASQLWPQYREDGFAPAAEFGLDRFVRNARGDALAWSSPDEPDPATTKAPGHWNYVGDRALQYWRLNREEARTGTLARVNGRNTYWMSRRPIPNGIAFENFELQRPFVSGEKSTYGVTTATASLENVEN